MAQIYILPFLSDNQLIVKKVAAVAGAYVPGTFSSLEMIKIPVPAVGTPIAPLITAELNTFGIIYEPSRSSQCITGGGDTLYIYKTNTPSNNIGIIFNVPVAAPANITDITESALIFQDANTLLPAIVVCRNAATAVPPPPAPTPSPKKFRLIRFLPPFFFPPPFIGQPFLSPYAPYGNSVIRTPVGSPFFRLPGLSLPPDFVPAVIPTVRQPMLSPFGNPFPTRVREPSPVYRNLFEEKSRPAHFRSPRFKMDGGYYSKYLKYKNKYLELKNQLENQV
jgi:hypothetical protein